MMKTEYSKQYKRDLKRALKSGVKEHEILRVVELLSNGVKLPDRYRDHQLTNSKRYKDCRECHIRPDLLLVYQIDEGKLTLILLRLGSHTELFDSTRIEEKLVFI